MKPIRRTLLSLGLALFVAGCDDDPTGTTLTSPINIEARALSPTSLLVSWASVAGASSYEVERAVGASGGTYVVAGTTTETQLEVDGLETGEQYRFRVTALSGSRRSDASNPSAAITVPDEIFSVVETDITTDRTFYADSTYVLSGFIKVGNGRTLTIEAGTKIVGDYQIPGSSLFILRGAKINAQGTAADPIVFTSERPVGQRQPGDWGGVIMIGNGIINRNGSTQIEGTGTPQNVNPAQFYHDGNNNDDDSGILRYVRIEFAGFPTAPNEELNSLTMAAVGRATRIEYVQILQGLDDSFEWFGGAVNGRYLISYEAADDHFDASEGYIGRNQFMIAFQSIRPEARPGLQGGVASDPQGIENDGCHATNCAAGSNEDVRGASTPYTIPTFANFTIIGAPQGAWETTGGNYGMMIRRGTGGLYVNGVISRYSQHAISMRSETTMERHTAGDLRFSNIYVSQTAGAFTPQNLALTPVNRVYALNPADHAIEMGTVVATSLFTALPANTLNANAASFNWAPAAGSPIATGGLNDFATLPTQLRAVTTGTGHPNSQIVPTTYRGAADPAGPAWWAGWTNYARN